MQLLEETGHLLRPRQCYFPPFWFFLWPCCDVIAPPSRSDCHQHTRVLYRCRGHKEYSEQSTLRLGETPATTDAKQQQQQHRARRHSGSAPEVSSLAGLEISAGGRSAAAEATTSASAAASVSAERRKRSLSDPRTAASVVGRRRENGEGAFCDVLERGSKIGKG